MSKQDRAETRRQDKEKGKVESQQEQLENMRFTYPQMLELVNKRDRLVQEMYSGLRVEVEKLGYIANYNKGVWTLDKKEETTAPDGIGEQ